MSERMPNAKGGSGYQILPLSLRCSAHGLQSVSAVVLLSILSTSHPSSLLAISIFVAFQQTKMSTLFVNPFDEAKFASRLAKIPLPSNDPDVEVSIFYRHFKPTSSSALPLLLLHGHPQTHVIWSSVAPALAATGKWEVVVPDNRGNGESSAPSPKNEESYSRYSKREMARDMIEVMRQLGHDKFWVVAHDRGARIAHRMALDWPDQVQKLVLLDIAPTVSFPFPSPFARYSVYLEQNANTVLHHCCV